MESAPDDLGMRVESAYGTILVSEAPPPPGASKQKQAFVAYWSDSRNRSVYLFERLLFTLDDLGQAVERLAWQRSIDPNDLTEANPTLQAALSAGAPTDNTFWRPATVRGIFLLLGYDATDEFLERAEFDAEKVRWRPPWPTGTYSVEFTAAAARQCPPAPIDIGPATVTETVTELDITGQQIDQDDPTNDAWISLSDGQPVYGGSEPSTADNVRLKIEPSPGTITDIVWTVEGDGGGSYAPPPTDPTEFEWDLGDILNPVPGEIAARWRFARSRAAAGDPLAARTACRPPTPASTAFVTGWLSTTSTRTSCGAIRGSGSDPKRC